MVKAIFYLKHQKFLGFHAQGHAGNAKKPLPRQDIVCAAVSVLSQSTYNALEYFLGESKISMRVEDGDLHFTIANDLDERAMHDAQILMQALYLGLTNLADSYPEYIEVKTREVD